MRTAVVSDLHANLEALDADLHRVDEMTCDRLLVLGDIVGYGADPNAVIERLVSRDAVCICGNHDLAVTGAFDASWFYDAAAAAISWTVENLSSDANGFLKELAPTREAG
jgi:fructose-1,6-bisphosphatase